MIAPFPDVPAEQTVDVTTGPLRYEDVSQDGRLLLTALPHFMGQAVFMGLMVKVAASRANAHSGILPILTRLTIEGQGGPVSIRKPITVRGGYQLAHTVDESGAVNRLQLISFASMTAPIGRTNPPAPPNAGEPVAVGRVVGEHVFTRPFAPPAERKVTRFAPGPWPEVPEARVTWRPPESLLELPEGATAVDEKLEPDDVPMVFGLTHTDSNQHVNSVVYPRLFEDAMLRRLAARGRDARVLARFVDTAYRKPCFAGQRMRILLRMYDRDGRSGAVGVFVPEEDQGGRPHTVARIEMG